MKVSLKFILATILLMLSFIASVEMLWISLHVFLSAKALASCLNRLPI